MGYTAALQNLQVDHDASVNPATGRAILEVAQAILAARAAVSGWPTPAADGGNPSVMVDKFGRLVVTDVPDDLALQSQLTLSSGASTQLFAAGGAGVRNKLTGVLISNTSGSPVRVDILDGATLGPSVEVAAAGGGATFWAPLVFKGSAATAMNVQLSSAVTDVRVFAVGYQTA